MPAGVLDSSSTIRSSTASTMRSGKRPRHRAASRAVSVNAHEAHSSRVDLPAGGVDALVRASVHYYNDESEVERFVRAVAG